MTTPTVDPEIAAMGVVYATLAPLPRPLQLRVADWVLGRLEWDEANRAAPGSAAPDPPPQGGREAAAPPPTPEASPGKAGPRRERASAGGGTDHADRIAALIRERGPLTPTRAAEALGLSPFQAGNAIRGDRRFVKVDPDNYKSPYTLRGSGPTPGT
jgi:hypothetical protein